MPEAGLPTVYTTEGQPTGSSGVALDTTMLRTPYGITKIVEMALDFLGFICIMSSGPAAYLPRGSWFNTVAMGGFWYSGIVLVLYLFHVPEKISKIPWKKIELIFTALWTFFYLIAASLAANYGSWNEAYAAAAFFGFVAMVTYGYDAWDSFGYVRGTLIVRTTTTTAQSPTTY